MESKRTFADDFTSYTPEQIAKNAKECHDRLVARWKELGRDYEAEIAAFHRGKRKAYRNPYHTGIHPVSV